jgi:hypothetical protein
VRVSSRRSGSQNGETLAPVTVVPLSGCLRCPVVPFSSCGRVGSCDEGPESSQTIFRQSMNPAIKLDLMLALQNLSIDGGALRANGSTRYKVAWDAGDATPIAIQINR